jgi:tripeptidyl-peptidase I
MKVFPLLLALVNVVCVSVASAAHVIHERRSVIPQTWTLTRRAPSSQVIPLRIGLKQSNTDRLYDELMTVSHPDSPHYGKHWSPQQVADFFRPSRETASAVKAWLVEAGFYPAKIKTSKGGIWLEVDSTVEQAEQVCVWSIFGIPY